MVDEDVCYVTDVEISEFFLAFVKASSALTLVKLESDGSADIELAAGWRFVHGGDACDKGGAVGGTVRVVKTLTRLKTRYPDRVHLILGNRDINKMRLTSECAPEEIAALEQIPGPYWVAPAKQVTPLMHLRAAVAARHRVAQDAVTPDMMAAANTLAARLRWMLDETYGAAGEFERRHDLDAKGMPEPLPDEITRRLNASGVDRLIIGHTPHGNCPTVARSGAAPGSEPGEPSCLVVMGDTSYSDMDQADNRGAAVAEVCVGRHGKVRVRGCLHDGREYDYTLAEGNGSKHDLVGQAEAASRAGVDGRGNPQPFFVKAQLVSGEVLMCNVNGYQVTYHTMPRLLAETVLNGKGGLRETSIAAVRSSDEGAAKRSSSPMAYLFHLPLFARKLLGRRPTLVGPRGDRSSNRSSKVTVVARRLAVGHLVHVDGRRRPHRRRHGTARRQMIEEAFQLTDTDGSGSLSLKRLKRLREKHAFLAHQWHGHRLVRPRTS